uniref:G0/G1 switch 2 n=1 Tax=Astyanax mexicanus TaxID=7994 RepID=A0A3B1JJH2_ASTMX
METMHEIIPFAKEMLSAGPSKGSMKIYLVGGTFAVLGMVSGMMEVACSFVNRNFLGELEGIIFLSLHHTLTMHQQFFITNGVDCAD